MTSTQRSRLGLLRLVVLGALGLPAFAATSSDVSLFGAGGENTDLLGAPPHFLLVVIGLALVSWAVGSRYLKGAAGNNG